MSSSVRRIKKVSLPDDKTAYLRLASIGGRALIICRIGFPIRDGYTLFLDQIEPGCSENDCVCSHPPSGKRTFYSLDLCSTCIQEIHNHIKTLVDDDPSKPIAAEI